MKKHKGLLKRETEFQRSGIWMVIFALLCCLGPILMISLGSAIIAAFMKYWLLTIMGALAIVGVVSYFLFYRWKRSYGK